jgi:hypothetical protein
VAVSESAIRDTFDERLKNLDLGLFERIESQTTARDKQSLLACQLAVRSLRPAYTYLEIGSHLGGSLQPYLPDTRCTKIYSIDKRPPAQPDERGITYEYRNNSTQRMLENLKAISEPALAKITCIDQDASQIDPKTIEQRPQFCFIDGEHTDPACFSDFLFCLKAMDANGLLVFHDAPVVYNGLAQIVGYLKDQRYSFNAYNLPDTVFVIEINDFPAHKTPQIAEMLVNNHVGYLASLQYNDHYRRFYNRGPFKWLRHLKVKAMKSNVSE